MSKPAVSIAVKVTLDDVDFPVPGFSGRVQIHSLTAMYRADRDGLLRVTDVSGRGFGYKQGGFEVGRARRNVYGFWSSVPWTVKERANRAVLEALTWVQAQ